MKILIIEDERMTAQDLKDTIRGLRPETEIAAILDSVEDAVQWFRTKPSPDVAFMDIQLADGLSFEIFGSAEVTCPVVFCTAFDEYAMQAFKSNGIDYILKPFDGDAIEKALDKIQKLKMHFEEHTLPQEKLLELQNTIQSGRKSSFLVSHRDKLIPVSAEDIAYFYIEHEITFIYTFDNRRFMLNSTLDELERTLDPKRFYRANRQFLVHVNAIVEAEHFFARKLLLKMNVPTKEQVVVSKAKASDFLHWLEKR